MKREKTKFDKDTGCLRQTKPWKNGIGNFRYLTFLKPTTLLLSRLAHLKCRIVLTIRKDVGWESGCNWQEMGRGGKVSVLKKSPAILNPRMQTNGDKSCRNVFYLMCIIAASQLQKIAAL